MLTSHLESKIFLEKNHGLHQLPKIPPYLPYTRGVVWGDPPPEEVYINKEND